MSLVLIQFCDTICLPDSDNEFQLLIVCCSAVNSICASIMKTFLIDSFFGQASIIILLSSQLVQEEWG